MNYNTNFNRYKILVNSYDFSLLSKQQQKKKNILASCPLWGYRHKFSAILEKRTNFGGSSSHCFPENCYILTSEVCDHPAQMVCCPPKLSLFWTIGSLTIASAMRIPLSREQVSGQLLRRNDWGTAEVSLDQVSFGIQESMKVHFTLLSD